MGTLLQFLQLDLWVVGEPNDLTNFCCFLVGLEYCLWNEGICLKVLHPQNKYWVAAVLLLKTWEDTLMSHLVRYRISFTTYESTLLKWESTLLLSGFKKKENGNTLFLNFIS